MGGCEVRGCEPDKVLTRDGPAKKIAFEPFAARLLTPSRRYLDVPVGRLYGPAHALDGQAGGDEAVPKWVACVVECLGKNGKCSVVPSRPHIGGHLTTPVGHRSEVWPLARREKLLRRRDRRICCGREKRRCAG